MTTTTRGAMAATLLLSIPLAAQTPASYSTFGQGCGGTPGAACVSVNWGTTSSGNRGGAINFAVLANTGATTRVICAVEFYTKTQSGSPASMSFWLYDKSSAGTPGNLLATTTMAVGGTAAVCRATFSVPVIIAANTDFFIVFDNRVQLALPIATTGAAGTHYHSGPPTWSGPYSTVMWAYRVICCGVGPTPKLGNTGTPQIGKQMSIDVSNVNPLTTALLAFGLLKTSIDLTVAGAPGCTLYTDPLILFGLPTTQTGTATLAATVPNDQTLIGVKFYNQFAILDPFANTLQLVFSEGGEATVGT